MLGVIEDIEFPGPVVRQDDGQGGYVEIPGKPVVWRGSQYRVPANTDRMIQAPIGAIARDFYRRLIFKPQDNGGKLPPAVINQVVTMADGERAKIILVRNYRFSLQVDLESGAV